MCVCVCVCVQLLNINYLIYIYELNSHFTEFSVLLRKKGRT